MNNKEYLERLFDSDKSLIIYRVKDGFDIFTDFFERFNLTTKNAKFFFNQTIKKTEDFNILWNRLIIKKKLLVSSVIPKKWFTIDNIKQLKIYNKK